MLQLCKLLNRDDPVDLGGNKAIIVWAVGRVVFCACSSLYLCVSSTSKVSKVIQRLQSCTVRCCYTGLKEHLGIAQEC